MNTEQLAAYVGAAAWLPQIISWIYQAYVTPQIEVIAGRMVSIGYTRFGPIFNLNLAFTAQRKSAVIDLLEVELIHEGGERHTFQMDGMSETMSELADASGNKTTTVSREQATLAFKIGTEVLLEKFVRFQEQKFHDLLEPRILAAGEVAKFERSMGGDYFSRLISCKEYNDILAFHREYFWWKSGRYDVIFSMRSPNRIRVKRAVFSFVLNQIDIDGLRTNLSRFPVEYSNIVRNGDVGYEYQKVDWCWRVPRLERKTSNS